MSEPEQSPLRRWRVPECRPGVSRYRCRAVAVYPTDELARAQRRRVARLIRWARPTTPPAWCWKPYERAVDAACMPPGCRSLRDFARWPRRTTWTRRCCSRGPAAAAAAPLGRHAARLGHPPPPTPDGPGRRAAAASPGLARGPGRHRRQPLARPAPGRPRRSDRRGPPGRCGPARPRGLAPELGPTASATLLAELPEAASHAARLVVGVVPATAAPGAGPPQRGGYRGACPRRPLYGHRPAPIRSSARSIGAHWSRPASPPRWR